MTFSKAAILGSVALALGLTFSLPQSAIISLGPDTARADVDISVNVGTFYDDLSPYGDWVNHSGAYVFVPGVSADWRPYTLGHWEYTRRYGWMWVSDERFGWATYHYGRWGYGDDLGWYWVPATRWAPAWVSWRRSNDYVAWAPLPPDRDTGFSINIDIDSDRYADRYWAVVPSRNFLDVDLGRVVFRDRDDRFRRVFRETRPLGRVRVENTIVVNNMISVTEIERATRKKVRAKEIREVRDMKRAGKTTAEKGDTIDVFAPDSKKNVVAKPKKIKSVEEVAARKRKNQPAATEDQAIGNAVSEEAQGNDAQGVKLKKDRQQKNATQGESDGGTQALTKKQRRQLQQTQDEGGTAATKKKRRQLQQSEEGQGNQAIKRKANSNQKALQQARKKKQQQKQRSNAQNRKKKQNCVQGAANCPG